MNSLGLFAISLVSTALSSGVVADQHEQAQQPTTPVEHRGDASSETGFEPCARNELSQGGYDWLDDTHSSISQTVCRQALWFDRFFGEDNPDDIANSLIRLRFTHTTTWEDDVDYDVKPRLRARYYLPNARKKLRLVISDDDQDIDDERELQEDISEIDQGDGYTTALRWIVRQSRRKELGYDIGLRWNSGIKTLLRVKYRRDYIYNERSRFQFRQTFYWLDGEGFGETTKFSYFHGLDDGRLFESTTRLEFGEKTRGIEWTHSLQWFDRLDDDTAVSYGLILDNETRPQPINKNVTTFFRYRRDLYQGWLYGEVIPSLSWPEERDRDATPELSLRLEMQFGEKSW